MFRSEFTTALERDQNNTSIISSYQTDDLIEKLKILNYENLLLKQMKMKPLNKFYFIKAKNSGEQFFMFVSICAWLIRETGKSFEQPQEFDDPNVLISKIVKALNDMDIPTDFQTNKLIQGSGPICIYIMDCLASKVLKLQAVQMQKVQIKADENTSLDIVENDSEIILEKVEEEQNAVESDSDGNENSLFDLNMSAKKSRNRFNLKDYRNESIIDNENFRLEMERVLPQLKVLVKSDPRDWRTHFDQIKNLKFNIDTISDEAYGQLKKLQNEIVFGMEKIESREKHLNEDLKTLIGEYKELSIELSKANTEIKDSEREKTEMEEELTKVTNELENIKIQMEQRGNSMTDGSPLINIKKAVLRLKEEISEMDIKIGVMRHNIDQLFGNYNEASMFNI